MDKKAYESYKDIKIKISKGLKVTFAERNIYNIIQKKLVKKSKTK